MGTFLKSMIALIAWLAIAATAGFIICMLIDVVPARHGSAMLPFAIWGVIGLFTGFVVLYNAAGWAAPPAEREWTSQPTAPALAGAVLQASLIVLAVLSGVFYWLYWSRGVVGEHFVPDSAPHTLTFFAATALAMLIGKAALTPKPKD